jgi:hypothetical protein
LEHVEISPAPTNTGSLFIEGSPVGKVIAKGVIVRVEVGVSVEITNGVGVFFGTSAVIDVSGIVVFDGNNSFGGVSDNKSKLEVSDGASPISVDVIALEITRCGALLPASRDDKLVFRELDVVITRV